MKFPQTRNTPQTLYQSAAVFLCTCNSTVLKIYTTAKYPYNFFKKSIIQYVNQQGTTVECNSELHYTYCSLLNKTILLQWPLLLGFILYIPCAPQRSIVGKYIHKWICKNQWQIHKYTIKTHAAKEPRKYKEIPQK